MVEAIRTYRLSDGVRCDADGLFYGDVQLLERAGDDDGSRVWRVRSSGHFDGEIAKRHGLVTDTARRHGGLAAVARALNEGDVAKAQIAALHLRLPSLPREPESLDKTFDDAKHPHWPAGNPDSVGGQFMPSSGGQPPAQQAEAGSPTHGSQPPKPPVVPQPGAVFHTAAEAARAVYAKLLPLSMRQIREYTFFYYRDNKTGLIGYTDPVLEGPEGGDNEGILPTSGGLRLSGVTIIGMGHTHASYFDINGMPTSQADEDRAHADGFSSDDLRFMQTNKYKFEIYTVGTPSGHILQYVPGSGVSQLSEVNIDHAQTNPYLRRACVGQLSSMSALSAEPVPNHLVPDGATAITIATAILDRYMGHDAFEKMIRRAPLKAELRDGVWDVYAAFDDPKAKLRDREPDGSETLVVRAGGGLPDIMISEHDAQVVHLGPNL